MATKTIDVQLPEAFRFLWQDTADDGLPVRYRAAYGGRGSGKSHSFAQALLLKAAERPLRIGCFREIQKSIRDSVKRLLDDKIKDSGLSGFYTSTDQEIRGANGSLFIFAGLRNNPDAIKSTEGIDIAAVFEARPVSQRSLDLLIPTIRKPGSEIWFEWNPEFETDPIETLLRDPAGQPPGSIVRCVNWHNNPFFPDVLRQELEYDKSRDPEKYRHIWEGEYASSAESRVFKNWVVEDFDAPADAIFRFGADWGFATDPTVLVRCYILGRRLYVDHEAYAVGCDIMDTPTLFMQVPDAEKWPIVADSARPETVNHMRKNGFPKIMSAVKGPKSLADGVEWLKSYDIIVHPRCRHLIDELRLYSYKRDPLTDKVLPVLEDKHNHVIDALRYACEAVRRNPRNRVPEKPVVHHYAPQPGSWMSA